MKMKTRKMNELKISEDRIRAENEKTKMKIKQNIIIERSF